MDVERPSSSVMEYSQSADLASEKQSLTESCPAISLSAREENDPETNWRLVVMACIVMFLGSIESTVIGQSEYPYMKEIDRDTSSSFFSLCTSFSQLGHAIFAIVFSYWTYKTNSVKGPLQAGRILAQAAGTLYLCVELFCQNRRYVMMTCYICFGIASSSTTVMRVYMVHVSSKADRVRAYSCMSLAGLLSVIIGPLCQMLFALVPYPGWEIFPGIALNIYSAPIWMAWIINAGSILLIHYTLQDIPRNVQREGFDWTWETFKEKFRILCSLDVHWWLVLLLWLQKINIRFTITTIQVVSSPFQMTLFDLDGQKTVLVGSASAAIVGVLAATCVALCILTPCTKKPFPSSKSSKNKFRITPRYFFFACLGLCLLFYVVSYPYPFDSHPLSPYNTTSETGCDPTEYKWCSTAKATSLYAYQVPNVLTNGVGFTLGGVAIDTIYSKVLGNIDQTLLQGAIVVVDDAMSFAGPIYAGFMFTSYGQNLLWIINFAVTAIVSLTWVLSFRSLRDFQ